MAESGLAFLLFYFLGLTLALSVRPVYGLYTYIAVFYLHPPSRWWGAAIPDLRWSFIAALVTLAALYLHRAGRRPLRPWHEAATVRILILYVVWMWLQWPWVISPAHASGVILFTKYVLLFYLIYAIVDNEKDLFGFCLAHVIGCGYFGWLVYMAPDGGRLEGVGGPGVDDANSLAMHLGTGVMFAAFLLLAAKGWARWIVLAAIPVILNGIIQTETRGALVGLLLGGLVTVYLKPKKYRRLYWCLAVVAVVGFLSIANDTFVERMKTLTTVTDRERQWDDSANNRVALAKAQLRMFVDYPFGAGHQGTTHLSRSYLDERWLARDSGDRASHNTVMSVLVDQGLPGIVLLTVLGVSVVRILRRLTKMDATGLPPNLGLYRAMIGGALATAFGAGMFAQNLKAEVLIWNLALLAAVWDLAKHSSPVKDPAVAKRPEPDSQVRTAC